MPVNNRIDELTTALAETNRALAETNKAVAETNRAVAENSKAIAQLTGMMTTTLDSIKALETVAESLLESANKHEATIAHLEKQWEAYLRRLPQN